jgi:hypothetical protein
MNGVNHQAVGAENRSAADLDVTMESSFVIHGQSQIDALLRTLDSNWRPFKERGRPLRVIVTSKDVDRLEWQIRFYFGILLRAISEQLVMEGQKHPKEVWDYHFRKQFLPYKLHVNPITGEQFVEVHELKRGKIGERRMGKFLLEVEAEAAIMGVMLPPRQE